jgi:addiction module HigA family antidote
MKRLRNVHPGEILQKDFLEPLGLTAYKLAKDIGVQQTRVSQILRGERAITLDTAMRLSRYFGTGPLVWLNLQLDYDLEELEVGGTEQYDAIPVCELVNSR